MPLSHSQVDAEHLELAAPGLPALKDARRHIRRMVLVQIEREHLNLAAFDLSALAIASRPLGSEFNFLLKQDPSLKNPTKSLRDAQVNLLCWRYVSLQIADRLAKDYNPVRDAVSVSRPHGGRGWVGYYTILIPKVEDPVELHVQALTDLVLLAAEQGWSSAQNLDLLYRRAQAGSGVGTSYRRKRVLDGLDQGAICQVIHPIDLTHGEIVDRVTGPCSVPVLPGDIIASEEASGNTPAVILEVDRTHGMSFTREETGVKEYIQPGGSVVLSQAELHEGIVLHKLLPPHGRIVSEEPLEFVVGVERTIPIGDHFSGEDLTYEATVRYWDRNRVKIDIDEDTPALVITCSEPVRDSYITLVANNGTGVDQVQLRLGAVRAE